jgi:hypothetical protein
MPPNDNQAEMQTIIPMPTPKEAKQLLRKASCTSEDHALAAQLTGSSSSEDDLPVRSTRNRRKKAPGLYTTRRNIIKARSVKDALREYNDAAAVSSPRFQLSIASPSMQDNIFSRQLSLSQSETSPLLSPYNLRPRSANRITLPPLASIDSYSNSKICATTDSRNDTKSSPRKLSTPLVSPYARILDDENPLIEFTRRLSNAAKALADRGYKTPDSGDDSGTTEDIHRSDIGPVATAAAAKSIMALKLQEMMEQIWKQQEDTITKVTKEHVTLQAQRLATLISTQPPSIPAPAQSQQDMNFLYRLAEEAAMYGAEKASLLYQKYFCDKRLPTVEQAKQLMYDNVGNIIDPMHSWLILEPGNDPRYFCSTMSRCPTNWHCTLAIPMNTDEMHGRLVADAARYRSAFLTSSLQYSLGGNIERQGASRYPLVDMNRETLARQQQLEELEQRANNHRQPIFERPQVAVWSVSGQPPTLEQWSRGRQPSWMMDLDEEIQEPPW